MKSVKRDKAFYAQFWMTRTVETWFSEPVSWWPYDKMWEMLKEGEQPYPVHSVRAKILRWLGAVNTIGAGNVIMDGCANSRLPGAEMTFGPYLQLLNTLEVKYTFLPKRHCCGWFLLMYANMPGAPPELWDDALSKVKALAIKNVEEAKKIKAKNIYQFCHMCHALAQLVDADAKSMGVNQGYGLDILKEPLEKVEKLRMVKPTKVGWYRGCWIAKKFLNPKLKIDFNTYRSWLDRIENLRIIDLPDELCCFTDMQEIMRIAKDNEIDYIVTPCNNCYAFLAVAGQPALMLSTLLLEAVTSKPVTKWSTIR
ncbi:MAG: heterodisulfide reductase-related iron-sulfur binding cluster [Candidatus Bathyarchaeia archaeon]